MENIAIKNGLKFFCHTADNWNGFIIEDITNKKISYGDFICNRSLFHASIKECMEHLNGTTRPIIFNGEDINPIRECEDIFLMYNPTTGETNRPINWRKYYKLIAEMTI